MISHLLSETCNGRVNKDTHKLRAELKEFIEALFKNSQLCYATFTLPVDTIDPLAYLEMKWNNHHFHYYWEKPSEEFAIAAGEALCTISASGTDRFENVNARVNDITNSTASRGIGTALSHPYSGIMFLGGFSFSDHINSREWESFQPASFTIPKWTLIKEGKLHLLTLSVDLAEVNQPAELYNNIIKRLKEAEQTIELHADSYPAVGASFSTDSSLPLEQSGSEYQQWIKTVTQAKNLIKQQRFSKLVLARQLSVAKNTSVAPTQVINLLRRQYHNCYNFLIHQPQNTTFLGSTPERLGAFRKNILLTEALAGSMQRGETATEDSILTKYLSGSTKNRAEHNFVVRDIEERLQDYTETINRSEQPEVKKLSNVQHLYTPIRAMLTDQTDVLTVLKQLHPTSAVGGYPREEAVPYIGELENFERGWYAGPIGWLNVGGCGEFAVGIRSGLLAEDKAHFFAGCGIVADSDPIAEWEETNLKLKPMLSALQYD